jgi:hypothetical protein
MKRPPDPEWDWILGRTIERTCRRIEGADDLLAADVLRIELRS